MHIVHVAAEFAPIAKAGGLGEVIIGLTRELSRIGQQVDVIIPKYDFIPTLELRNLQKELSFPLGTMWSADIEGCHLHLLETPNDYFTRGKIYGFNDDATRFVYFSRAVAEYLKIKNQSIDVLHLHDWHTAPMAALLDLPTVLNIHNIEYQGECALHDLTGIKDLAPFESLNLLHTGIQEADALVAVSPTYAKEILTPEFGFGLDALLRKHKSKLTGILNGIDLKLWDPGTDFHLKANYNSTDSLEKIVAAKKANREGIPIKGDFWVGAITRLVPQKGPELIEAALEETIKAGGAFALIGTSPFHALQHHFELLKFKYENHPQVFLHLEYDEKLAHQLYAALDFLVVPSLYEPCGLTQMIAMHYGTIPIVRATGGLKDTVFDCDDPNVPASQRNGYVFTNQFLETLHRAIDLFRADNATHLSMVRRGMQADFGWKKPAQEYLRLYHKLAPSDKMHTA